MVRLLGVLGVVGAAAAAHVAAGAELPDPVLLTLLVLGLTGLAGLARRLPAPARSVRVRLAAAVALQPLLHGVFDHADGRSGAAATMLLAHLAAAGLGVWWTARGAERLAVAVGVLVRRLTPTRPMPVPGAPRRIVPQFRPLTTSVAVLLRTAPRRGPPIGSPAGS